MMWKDTDPPATEINAARMRAKYYSARYIIHRPVLYHALHHYGQVGARVGSIGQTWTPATVNLRELPSKYRRACKICVESVILSTEAFDGIKDRLVVPNIFGTAHAYVFLLQFHR